MERQGPVRGCTAVLLGLPLSLLRNHELAQRMRRRPAQPVLVRRRLAPPHVVPEECKRQPKHADKDGPRPRVECDREGEADDDARERDCFAASSVTTQLA